MGFQSAITTATASLAGMALTDTSEKKINKQVSKTVKNAYGEFMMGLNPEQRQNLIQKQDEANRMVQEKIKAMQFQESSVNSHLSKLRGASKKEVEQFQQENIGNLKQELEKLVNKGGPGNGK